MLVFGPADAERTTDLSGTEIVKKKDVKATKQEVEVYNCDEILLLTDQRRLELMMCVCLFHYDNEWKMEIG